MTLVRTKTGSSRIGELLNPRGPDSLYTNCRSGRGRIKPLEQNLRRCETCGDYEGKKTEDYDHLKVFLCITSERTRVYLCDECLIAFNQFKPGFIQIVGI